MTVHDTHFISTSSTDELVERLDWFLHSDDAPDFEQIIDIKFSTCPSTSEGIVYSVLIHFTV